MLLGLTKIDALHIGVVQSHSPQVNATQINTNSKK